MAPNNRYSYIYSGNNNLFGPNLDKPVTDTSNYAWKDYIDSVLSLRLNSIDPRNQYNDIRIKPIQKEFQSDDSIKQTEAGLTNMFNNINAETFQKPIDLGKQLFQKEPAITTNTKPSFNTSNTTVPYSLEVNANLFNTNYAPTTSQLSSGLDYNTLSSYNKAMNATITTPNTTAISSGTPVESGFDASKATSAVTEGGGSSFNWKAGAGMAAGLAKAAYNKWAPNLYTQGVDDDLQKAAYESIYGDSSQDPLARLATSVTRSNEDRMKNVTNYIDSRVPDYSNIQNNDNLANVYQDLSDLKTIDYEGLGTEDYAKLAAPAVAPFIAPFAPVTSTILSWGPLASKNKMVQDVNQSTAQGALAGLSYSNGNGWWGLAGAGIGTIAGIVNLIGAKKRTQLYNDAVEKAKQDNIDSFYGTARRNTMNEIFNDMRYGHIGAEGGSLEELNGVTTFRGIKHGQFGLDGIPQGIASDGLPNYVEGGGFDKNGNPLEGEVKYKDYIYSARLKPSKSMLKDFNLPEKYAGKTFAELADILQKESEDRPNDPISLQTLDDWMSRLAGAQEEYKAKAEERRLAKVVDNMSNEEKAALLSSLEQPMAQQEGIDLSQPMYAKGGKIYIKPENRGKFTALKKRTGKSASWFKAHGTPAQKKMATFALNAAKWHKHEDGGHLFPWGGKPWEVGYIYDNDIAQPTTIDGTVVDTWGDIPYPLRVQNPVVVEDNNSTKSIDWSNLRYAPAVGAGLGALTALLQPKDYYLADALRDISKQYKPMAAPHIGGKRKPKTYDVNLGDAENLAMQAAALRANRSNANRGQQTAGAIGLINAFEKQNALRNLEWQKANEANRLATDQYNLGIDQFNAQRDSQYDQLNQQILNNRLNMLSQAAQAADASRTAWANNISSTTENAFNQLGNVGKDEWNRYQFLQWLKQHPATARAWGYEV